MRPAILLCLLLLAVAPRAFAAPRLALEHTTVRAGSEVELRWTADAAGVEEVEIELSLAGSAWQRISPELEAREGRFVWRVPAGFTGEARLRLRYGGEHGEEAGEPVALRIEADDVPHAAAVRVALETPGDGPLPADALEGACVFRMLAPPTAETAPRGASAEPSAGESTGPAYAAAERGRDAQPRARRFEAPRRAPLRN